MSCRLAGLETQLTLLEGKVLSAFASAAQEEPGSGNADPFELEPALLSTGSLMQSKVFVVILTYAFICSCLTQLPCLQPSNIELPVSAAPSAAGDSEHLEEIDPEPGGNMARA